MREYKINILLILVAILVGVSLCVLHKTTVKRKYKPRAGKEVPYVERTVSKYAESLASHIVSNKIDSENN